MSPASTQQSRPKPTAAPAEKRPTSWLHLGGVVAVILVVGAVMMALQQRFGAEPEAAPTAVDLAAVSGQGQATPPPWPAPLDVPDRVQAAGLTLGPMGTAEHYHPELSITVNGQPLPIPANIGVDPRTGQMAAVHTHTPDGVIHIEAARTDQRFTLGQLFTLWNVKLSKTQIGAVRADPGQRLSVTVNGEPVTGDPAHLLLAPNQRIQIAA
jgi:hypothetical protein